MECSHPDHNSSFKTKICLGVGLMHIKGDVVLTVKYMRFWKFKAKVLILGNRPWKALFKQKYS